MGARSYRGILCAIEVNPHTFHVLLTDSLLIGKHILPPPFLPGTATSYMSTKTRYKNNAVTKAPLREWINFKPVLLILIAM